MWSKTYSRDIFILTAIYKFCCKGAYCPECPLHLTLHVTGQTLTVTRSLGMSCENHIFNTSVKVTTRPGAYDIQVRKCSRKDEVKIFSSPPIVLPYSKFRRSRKSSPLQVRIFCGFLFGLIHLSVACSDLFLEHSLSIDFLVKLSVRKRGGLWGQSTSGVSGATACRLSIYY